MAGEYEGMRRLIYGDGATFVPVCSRCGRFVKADEAMVVKGDGSIAPGPNATCARCGRVEMIFEGFLP